MVEVIEDLVSCGSIGLFDVVFEFFKCEIVVFDLDYVDSIGLLLVMVEILVLVYFVVWEVVDFFVWVVFNLVEV